MTHTVKSFGGSYASRVVAAMFFITAIGLLMMLFVFYSEGVTESVKTIALMLLGAFSAQSATAFNRLADPSQDDINKLNETIEALRKKLTECEHKLTEQAAAFDAREQMQTEIIQKLINSSRNLNDAPLRIEHKH